MNDLVAIEKIAEWEKLKALVLDSISSPITKRVYNMALNEFIAWVPASADQPRGKRESRPASAWGTGCRSSKRVKVACNRQNASKRVRIARFVAHITEPYTRCSVFVWNHMRKRRIASPGSGRWERVPPRSNVVP
jgi:hypothetical protein